MARSRNQGNADSNPQPEPWWCSKALRCFGLHEFRPKRYASAVLLALLMFTVVGCNAETNDSEPGQTAAFSGHGSAFNEFLGHVRPYVTPVTSFSYVIPSDAPERFRKVQDEMSALREALEDPRLTIAAIPALPASVQNTEAAARFFAKRNALEDAWSAYLTSEREYREQRIKEKRARLEDVDTMIEEIEARGIAYAAALAETDERLRIARERLRLAEERRDTVRDNAIHAVQERARELDPDMSAILRNPTFRMIDNEPGPRGCVRPLFLPHIVYEGELRKGNCVYVSPLPYNHRLSYADELGAVLLEYVPEFLQLTREITEVLKPETASAKHRHQKTLQAANQEYGSDHQRDRDRTEAERQRLRIQSTLDRTLGMEDLNRTNAPIGFAPASNPTGARPIQSLDRAGLRNATRALMDVAQNEILERIVTDIEQPIPVSGEGDFIVPHQASGFLVAVVRVPAMGLREIELAFVKPLDGRWEGQRTIPLGPNDLIAEIPLDSNDHLPFSPNPTLKSVLTTISR